MVPVIVLLALTLFTWVVAIWATMEEEHQEEPTQKDTEKPIEQPKELRKVA